MPSTPSTRWALQRPADGDLISTWPASMRTTIDAIDALMVGFTATLPRPSAAVLGRFHRDSGTGIVSFDTGSGWAQMTQTPHAADHVEGAADPIKGQVPIGGEILYAGGTLPPGTEWDWADGGLIDKTTYATFFTRVQHNYNGGVDPGANKVRKPDKRGRVPMGADNFGPLGAANRITVASATRGANGGVERVTLASTESGLPAHAHSQPSHSHSASSDVQLSNNFSPNTPPLAGIGSVLVANVAGGVNAPYANNSNPWTGNSQGHGHGIAVDPTTPGNVNNNGAAGAGASHQNLQPFEADTYLVRIA